MESTQYEAKLQLGEHELQISTGKMARQASGAVVVRYAGSVVLVTATLSKNDRDIDYFPLMVDFEEKMYAAGKIPGGFIKREGRASDHAVISARLVDRAIRPLFPKGFKKEVQVVCLALSSDMENPIDVLGLVGASTALSISEIPFDGPVASVRVGRVDGKFIVNPTFAQQEEGDIDIVIAGNEQSVMMVEGEMKEISEADFLEALEFAREPISKLIALQREIASHIGKAKVEFVAPVPDEELARKVEEFAEPRIRAALDGKMKTEREADIAALVEQAVAEFATDGEAVDSAKVKEVKNVLEGLEKRLMRERICKDGVRPDGRSKDEIRPISCDVALLPRTHGSAMFTRGQTQVLSAVTLGSPRDAQRIDGISNDIEKQYMHQYNFPPFSVGEVRMMRGPSRRDIGHGMLAERAVAGMIPNEEEFPYAIRVVSEVLESNGSSSMASVCASSMSLMDAGVPLKSPVAGIAMGLVIEESGAHHVLTDIQGVEDHLGDMDFKVAGTSKGITAVQMDIKVKGVTAGLMKEAMEKARVARMIILGKMNDAISSPRPDVSPYAPRLIIIKIDIEKIGTVIGPGGKTIRRITDETGVKVDIEDDGRVLIYTADAAAGEAARKMVEDLVAEVEVGKIYEGIVRRIVNFGAFVEVLPGTDGLVHISQIAPTRINQVEDVLSVGQKVRVKVREIDDMNRVNLTMKDVPGALDPDNNPL
ncbi:MAG TPA: polyribonucleotide nucleotidyltransferase [bacterium]|nr:MAG: Polyribonucleotide nucleotidyltransferase [bacterium ADurb.Bin236]HPI75589.1 polyribonucleotide nucleotidyltransferase [bacterium]HPN94954.1 polyribonucleotide nucleotidyltransferase [bacterium]